MWKLFLRVEKLRLVEIDINYLNKWLLNKIDIGLYNYSYMSFDIGVKSIDWRKDSIFGNGKWYLENCIFIFRRMKFGFFFVIWI